MTMRKPKLVLVGTGHGRANAEFELLLFYHAIGDGSAHGCSPTDDMLDFTWGIDPFSLASVS